MAKKSEQASGVTSKTQAVKELLAGGLERPMEISAKAKAQYGLDIPPNYVSMIKSGLKKGKGKKRRAVKGNKMVAVAARQPRDHSGDLSLENLALRFALRAGSIDRAISALDKLR